MLKSARGRFRWSRPTFAGCRNTGSKPNFSESSCAHWSQRCTGHSTSIRRAIPRSTSSRAIIPASIVLPTPTSSAMRRRTGSSRSAMISGTNWYGRGLNERRPAHRNGAALLRSNNRAASKRIRLAVGSPTTSGFGGEKDVDFRSPCSNGRNRPTDASSEPVTGLTLKTSPSSEGRTIQSLSRARTRLPYGIFLTCSAQILASTSHRRNRRRDGKPHIRVNRLIAEAFSRRRRAWRE